MTIAEELARERAAKRAAEDRDPRGIDDLDSLDALETLDWNTDPWDDAEVAGTVERLRWQTRSIKWVAYAAMVLVVALILAAGGVGWWYIRQLNPEVRRVTQRASRSTPPTRSTRSASVSSRTASSSTPVSSAGTSSATVAWRSRRGTTRSRRVTTWATCWRRCAPPAQTYNKVTFPEGFTVAQMAQRLDEKVVPMTADGFNAAMQDPALVANFRPFGVTSLEGLLFPDTYQVSNGESEGQVISRMLSQMERVGSQEDIVTQGERLFQSPYGILTIASMIKREAKTGADRAPGSSTTGWASACRWPSTAVRYGTLQAGLDPDTVPFGDQRNMDAVEHVHARGPATHADRQPRARRRSRPPSTRPPTPASVTRSAPTCPRTRPASTSST